jgi:AraC-like DNA-binding protein
MKASIPPPALPGHTVPAAYAEQLVRLVRRWDIMPEELLSGLGLDERAVEDPQGRISVTTYGALIERARELTGEPGLGFYMGLQRRVSAYGYLGFAAMSAASLGEALELFVRFTPMLTTSISLRLEIDHGMASLIIDEHGSIGTARDFALISLMVGMWQIGKMLTGREFDAGRAEYAELAIPQPTYFERFKHLVPGMRFDQPVSRVVFDAKYLELPLALADRAALRLASEQCERALDALGYEGDFPNRVRRALGGEHGFRSLDEVAAHVRVSARTLKRRLAERGISFSALLDEARRERAMILLQSPRVSLEEAADRLGYSSLSNFVRAFHRWTGETPAAYRRARTSVPPAAGSAPRSPSVPDVSG